MRSTIKIMFFIMIASLFSCKKYLDEKVTKSQYIPNTLDDLQALLDNPNVYVNGPFLAELIGDNYYVTTNYWQNLLVSFPALSLNYNWSENAIPIDASWNAVYRFPVYISNIVLDHLESVKVAVDEHDHYNAIKGSSLFYRAFSFYELTQLYCKPYSSTANNDLGIVLRMTSDINVNSVRATVKDSYDKIIVDLKVAVELLPVKSSFPTRPTKAAAYGLLARVYLSMRDYKNAETYANLCLQQKNELLDYNSLLPLQSPRITIFNNEVIYHNVAQNSPILGINNAKVDSILYKSYSDSDLRKTVFFRSNTGANAGTFSFVGSYNGAAGQSSIFDGITTAEMYLIRAECYARLGNIAAALVDLNTLMKKRWDKNVVYQEITAINADDAKSKVLLERKKELVFRGQRWSDIRRLNMEGANITLSRIIDNFTYTLPPNDLRSVMLIPYDVINRSGIAQNPR